MRTCPRCGLFQWLVACPDNGKFDHNNNVVLRYAGNCVCADFCRGLVCHKEDPLYFLYFCYPSFNNLIQPCKCAYCAPANLGDYIWAIEVFVYPVPGIGCFIGNVFIQSVHLLTDPHLIEYYLIHERLIHLSNPFINDFLSFRRLTAPQFCVLANKLFVATRRKISWRQMAYIAVKVHFALANGKKEDCSVYNIVNWCLYHLPDVTPPEIISDPSVLEALNNTPNFNAIETDIAIEQTNNA